MRYLFAFIMLLCSGAAFAASNDVLLNLKDPASSNPLFPTLRVEGKTDGATNPSVKLQILPCIASAVAPVWTEGSIVPCSVDLAGALRILGGGGGGGGTSSLFAAAFPASGTAAGYFDGTNMQGSRVHDLDTGAGTEYNLGANLRFSGVGGSVEAGTLANPLRVDPTGTTTQPISAVGLPLPTGAATSALQITGNSSLANLDVLLSTRASEATLGTRLADATFTGRFAAAFLSADAIANLTTTAVHGFGYMYNGATWDRIRGTIADGLLVNLGANNDVTVTGTVTANAGTNLNTSALVLDATITNRFPAGSTPADNESNVVTISRIGNFAYVFDGVAWDRWTGAVSQSGTWNINNISGTVSLPTGAATEATLSTRLADATFTGRINTLGQKVMAASTPVVLPSDQSAIPVTVLSTVGSANIDGTCPSGAASFTVAASNASRTWLALWASPANTDDVYIKLGATATSADARIAPGQPINFVAGRIYTGVIDAFPNSGTQAVCVMELN